ncbi:MAG: hypothetical protein A2X86_12590 [Bdellovibrionales bacterium GWA2_49_15]|nr:MAG: hypothetical protein A2X86_12590 [Bdellovibrionales bacterium GWA2_49_15]HAZ14690.1 glycosyl transferase family 2 [Bdellovibrionales bacterium]
MHNKVKDSLSVIIPVGPGEAAYCKLLQDLFNRPFEQRIEVIFSAIEQPPSDLNQSIPPHVKFIWIAGKKGRAEQLNRGAKAAMGETLWFVHADSRFDNPQIMKMLTTKCGQKKNSFFYFDLRFSSDGPRLMPLNQLGVWIRSHIFGIPFGDQAFVINRHLFWQLGGFREDVPYGEDHLFVWAARHAGFPIQPIGHYVFTSARRYELHGWGKTTIKHMWLTFLQTIPLAINLVFKKRLKKGKQL